MKLDIDSFESKMNEKADVLDFGNIKINLSDMLKNERFFLLTIIEVFKLLLP